MNFSKLYPYIFLSGFAFSINLQAMNFDSSSMEIYDLGNKTENIKNIKIKFDPNFNILDGGKGPYWGYFNKKTGTLAIYDLRKNKVFTEIPLSSPSSARDFVVDSTEKKVYVGYGHLNQEEKKSYGELGEWDVANKKLKILWAATTDQDEGEVAPFCIRFFPDGKRISYRCFGRKLGIYNIDENKNRVLNANVYNDIIPLEDNNLIFRFRSLLEDKNKPILSLDSKVTTINIETGEVVNICAVSKNVWCLLLKKEKLFMGLSNGLLKIENLEKKKSDDVRLSSEGTSINHICDSPDDDKIIICCRKNVSSEYKIKEFDINTKKVKTLSQQKGRVQFLKLVNGKIVAGIIPNN